MTVALQQQVARPEDAFQDFFRSYPFDGESKYRKRLAQIAVSEGQSLIVDFEDLISFDPNLARMLVTKPDEYIQHAERAAISQMKVEDPEYAEQAGRIFVRFRRLPEKKPLRKIGAEDLNRMVLVDGIIVRVSQVKPMIVKAKFQCLKCLEIILEDQEGELMRGPAGSVCPLCKQRSAFKLLEEESVFKNTQEARIQERPEDLPPGQLPRYMDLRLEVDMVDFARPGDRVGITSIVRAQREYYGERGKLRTFTLYFDANYIDILGKETDVVEITVDDEKKILEAAEDPWIHHNLVASIAPSIYGYENVKEAILYLLCGGVAKHMPDGINIRGDSNVLIVGDPGIAKSQLLQYVARTAPRGLYTSGRGTTAAGLTAAVLREKTGGMILEAGALVLADKGVACLHPENEVLVDGRPQRIADLFDEGNAEFHWAGSRELEISTLNRCVAGLELGKVRTREMTATLVARRSYDGPMLKVHMRSGMELRLTPDHPVLDGNTFDWKPIGEFNVGDGVVALQKLPPAKSSVRIFDIIPDNWIVQPLAEEKLELRHRLESLHGPLAQVIRHYGLKRDAFGRGAFKVSQFREILRDLQLLDSWPERPFAYGRSKWTQCLNVSRITPELAFILGFAYGDGNTRIDGKHSSIQVSQSPIHSNYVDNLQEIMKLVSNRPWKVRRYPEREVLTAASNLLAYLFKWLTGNGLENLLRLDNEALAGFLAGSIDADGCISIRGRRYKSVLFSLKLSNDMVSSRRLVWALRRFDVFARIRPGKGVIEIQMSSRADIWKLINAIARWSKKAKSIPSQLSPLSAEHESVPSRPLQAILSRLRPKPTLLLRSGDWSTFHGLRSGQRRPYKLPLRRLIDALDHCLDTSTREDLLSLASADYAVERIESIEIEHYKGYVYDLRVPEGEHFVTEGVLTHNCVDELDKMKADDRVAIHEALEQQTVSIAKGGIVATLNARAAVLAAANPALGRYEPHLNVTENINLPVTILSRFDLIFILRDTPDKDNDEQTSQHILNMHKTLSSPEAPFTVEFLRKYISYAKRLNPVLSPEATQELNDFYLKMRSKSGASGAAVAITPRQLEGIIRLTEARARALLHKQATMEDARGAIKIMTLSLLDVGVDVQTGAADIDVIMTGTPKSTRDKYGRILDVISELSKETGTVEESVLYKILAEKHNINENEARQLIRRLLEEGTIFAPQMGRLKKTAG